MTNPKDPDTSQTSDTELREKLKALKPHSDDQLPLGNLLSVKETEAIMSLFNLYATKRETALLDELESCAIQRQVISPRMISIHTYKFVDLNVIQSKRSQLSELSNQQPKEDK